MVGHQAVGQQSHRHRSQGQFHRPLEPVIGKDGIVKKVIIGVGPGDTEILKQAIDAAMKG
jgi:hypothetical protein